MLNVLAASVTGRSAVPPTGLNGSCLRNLVSLTAVADFGPSCTIDGSSALSTGAR